MAETPADVVSRRIDDPEPAEPYLCHRGLGVEPRRWTLPAGGVVTIGRSAATDVCLPWDAEISRVHATMERIGGLWTVLDDGLSRNGTYVNGVRVAGRVRLRDRDTIRLGSTMLTFCRPAQTGGPPTVVRDSVAALPRLTAPQRAVLVALCRPYAAGRLYSTPASNQQIAAELFLSLDAVKTHLRVLFHKFGIVDLPQNRKRTRLVELALQSGTVAESEL